MGRDITAVTETFESEFGKFEHFVVTDKPGRGTLKITVRLIDVVSKIPPEPLGRGDIYIRDLGQATLVLEVFDSVTGEILARVTDQKMWSQRLSQRAARELTFRKFDVPFGVGV